MKNMPPSELKTTPKAKRGRPEGKIQETYVASVKTLPARYIPRYTDKNGRDQPLLFQHLLGSAGALNGEGEVWCTPGIPDTVTFFIDKDRRPGVLYIEFKAGRNKPTHDQAAIIAALQSLGLNIHAEVHWSAESAFNSLLSHIGIG